MYRLNAGLVFFVLIAFSGCKAETVKPVAEPPQKPEPAAPVQAQAQAEDNSLMPIDNDLPFFIKEILQDHRGKAKPAPLSVKPVPAKPAPSMPLPAPSAETPGAQPQAPEQTDIDNEDDDEEEEKAGEPDIQESGENVQGVIIHTFSID